MISNEAKQLTLFDVNATGLLCCYCANDPGFGRTYVHWNGFKDLDTGQFVGRCCFTKHYQVKSKGEHAHKYSEFPVILDKYFLDMVHATKSPKKHR